MRAQAKRESVGKRRCCAREEEKKKEQKVKRASISASSLHTAVVFSSLLSPDLALLAPCSFSSFFLSLFLSHLKLHGSDASSQQAACSSRPPPPGRRKGRASLAAAAAVERGRAEEEAKKGKKRWHWFFFDVSQSLPRLSSPAHV